MWELLYETFWDRLEHFCFNLCRDEARAEDLTQEVFLRALQNRTLINSFTERQCKAWLFTTARNLYCDQLRRAAKEEQLTDLTGIVARCSAPFSRKRTMLNRIPHWTRWKPPVCWLCSPRKSGGCSPCAIQRATMPVRSVSCSVSRPARSAAALLKYAIASKLNLRRIK